MNMICPSCGAEMPSEAVFCDQCGSRLPRRDQAAAPAGASLRCPQCGTPATAGHAYCEQCGAPVATGPAPPVPQRAPAAPPAAGPAGQERVVRLVMANNSTIILPTQAEVIIGREDSLTDTFPDVDLTPYGASEQGVSRRHARIVADGGQYFVEDLESKNYTFVNQERVKPGERRPLQPGDQLRFGRVVATFQITRPT